MESVGSAIDEQAFLDGTHSALVGGNAIESRVRPSSPTLPSQLDSPSARSHSRSSSRSSNQSDSSITELNSNRIGKQRDGHNGNGGGFSAIDNSGEYGDAVEPIIRSGRNGAVNTGPKGVIQDYNQHHSNQPTTINNLSSNLNNISLSNSATPLISLSNEEDQDDELLAIESYRNQRLNQLRGSSERFNKGDVGGKSKYFGHLREIGIDQFLTAIEEDDGIAVILHIYDSEFPACDLLNFHLSSLARSNPYAKFLRALASELDFAKNIESATLPTLIIYRFGELETSIIGVDREWGNGSLKEIGELLISHGALVRDSTNVQSKTNPVRVEDDDFFD